MEGRKERTNGNAEWKERIEGRDVWKEGTSRGKEEWKERRKEWKKEIVGMEERNE